MITVKNLSKSFGPFHALKDISLHVNRGEIYGFIGHNGAGKTTTMNILTGLSRPDSGECAVNGKNAGSIHHPGELGIGYLPEEPRFYPWMTAYETLEYLGNSARHTLTRSRNLEILDWVGLGDAAARRVGGFSRGMRQRLGIASALIHDPELIFLDEPSSALDPEGRSDVLGLIREMKGDGKTIFFSTHILDDVERVCDRVAMLVQGRIVLEKSLQELLSGHLSPIFDIVVRGADEQAAGKLRAVEGVTAVTADRDRITVTADNADAVSPRLLGVLAEAGLPVQSFALRKNTLEDIFIKEVNHQC